jgi:hypothetical protein
VQNNKKPVKQKATKPPVSSVKKKHDPNPAYDEEIKDAPIVLVKKTGTGAIIFFALLSLLLAAAVFYLWNHPRVQESTVVKDPPATIAAKTRNAGEQKLIDSLRSASFILLNDSVYGKNIIVSDTVLIQKDSLHINGNNLSIKADTSYKGPAFFIANSNRYLLIENLVLENFDIGILSQNKKMVLKNVRFVQCRVPVQSDFMLPENKYVSGRIADSVLFQTDSLPKK